MSINRVNISGGITRDPELRSTAAGANILTFTLAVSDRRKNPQTQQWEDVANYIPCVVFGGRAESLSRFLAKGMKCAVEGKLRWSQWQDKQTQKNRSKIEVIVDEIEFMSQPKGQNQAQGNRSDNYASQYQSTANTASQQPSGYYPQPQAPTADVYADSDIPF